MAPWERPSRHAHVHPPPVNKMTQRLWRSSLHFLLTLLVVVLAGSASRAQSCDSQMGWSTGDGFSCSEPLMMDFSGASTAEYWMDEDSYLESLVKSMIVGLGDNSPGLEPLSGSGVLHLPSGQLKYRWNTMFPGGLGAGSRMSIGAKFHSYHVEPGDLGAGNGSIPEDEDVTYPFGAGWTPSWFQGLMGDIQIPAAGDQPDITWVDSEGVSHKAEFKEGIGTFTPIGPLGLQTGTSYAYYVWEAKKNARLVYDAARSVFYREYANRVCVEFSPCSNYGTLTGSVSYWPSRIYRGENPTSPDWSIEFTYSSVGSAQRLTKIKDARGFEFTFTWTQPSTGIYRVTKISVSHQAISAPAGGWSAYDVDLTYDSNDRLEYVKPPDWSFLYSPTGTVAGLSSVKTGLGLKFGYNAIGLLTDIYRVIKSSSGDTEEKYLEVTYETATGQEWKVTKLVENPVAPAGTLSRTTNVTYTINDMTVTDANSVVHKYTRDVNLGQPSSWNITKYTRTSNGTERPWEYTWSSCGCGRLETVKLPTGRIIRYGYDEITVPDGRGLLTSVTLTDSTGNPGGSAARRWNLTYEAWGDPGTTGAAYYKASKLASFQYYVGTTGKTWAVNNSWSGGVLTSSMTSFTGSHTYIAKEDKWQRLTSIEEPTFTGGGSGNSRVKTLFDYETSASSGGYGLLKKVTRYPNGATAVTTEFTRNSLGHVTKIKDEKGGFTDLTLDTMGNVTQILGPQTTSGADSASSFRPKTVLSRSLFGGVARSKVYAFNAQGNPYSATIDSEFAENLFGELIESKGDGRKLSSSTVVPLITKRTYDSLGRLTKIELPGGRETQYELDDFDMITKVKVRPDGSSGSGSWPTRSFTYNMEGKHLSSTDATGKVTSYTYDSYGRVATIQRTIDGSNWRKAVMTYNTANGDSYRYLGKVAYSVSSGGTQKTIAERTWTRDDFGRLDETVLKSFVPSTSETKHKYTYNGFSRISEVKDVTNDRWTSYEYDAGGSIKEVQDRMANENSIEVGRNQYGEVTQLIRHRVRESATGAFATVSYKDEFTYDALGRLKQTKRFGKSSSQLAVRQYGFDSLGNLGWFSDQQEASSHKVTEVEFDTLGRTRKTTRHPVGSGSSIITTQEFTDGLSGVPDGTDGFGRNMDQSLVGQIHKRVDARGLATKYFYDKLGNLIHRRLPGYSSTTQGRGWSYKYDAEGRLEEWKDGNGSLVKMDRDGYGRVTVRYVASGTDHLSTMTTYERFLYSDTDLTTTHKTFHGGWYSSSQENGTLLNQVVVTRDGLGRLLNEDFGFADDLTGNHGPAFVKGLAHGYGSGDTTFRRSLHLTGSDWKFEFTPDAAGKMRTIAIAAPRPGGTGNHTFDHTATYTYEGGRVATRRYGVSSGGNTYNHTMTQQFDDLGYLKSITTDFDINGSGSTQVFSFEQGMDLVGNVKWRKYSKVNGKAGDYYKLDGHNRVEEVKLGVPSAQIGPSTTYGGATTYDEKLTYVLDAANNWDSVQSSINGTNDITIASDTNEYSSVNGSSPLTYDDNGNLVADFYRIFVYDYLDRLCEVYEDPNYSPLMMGGSSSTSTRTSSTSTNKSTAPSLTEVRAFLSSARASDLTTYSVEKGIGAYLTREAKKTTKTSSQTQSASATVDDYDLKILYGYDPNNRRLYRGLADPSPTGQQWWYTYDGWQQLEEWENYMMWGILVPMKVNFDGIGIDEHLGYAKYNTTTYTWDRYLLTQDALGTVHGLLDPLTGNALERYEYDAYGKRSVYRLVSSTWTLMTDTIYQSAYGFTGRRHDPETGLCYYRNRYYWPEIGRFITLDPGGLWKDVVNTGSGFTYAGSMPATRSDPLGLLSLQGGTDRAKCIKKWNAYDAAVEKREKKVSDCVAKKLKEGLLWNSARWLVTSAASSGGAVLVAKITATTASTGGLSLIAAGGFALGAAAGIGFDWLHAEVDCRGEFPSPEKPNCDRPLKRVPSRGICTFGCHGGATDYQVVPDRGLLDSN